ncbi:MAG: cytochrome c [Candidatus Didemnitutus sp.]|nr:cytochrome c [Candidatus Didemnitutus sp.]
MKSRTAIALFAALAFAASSFAADGTAVWNNHCSSCHGADGKGDTKMGKKLKIKDLTDAAYQASFTDEAAFNAVKIGVKTEAGKTVMKAIEEVTDEEINAVVVYLRTLKK